MKSPGYKTAPHEWGLKAGFTLRCFVARTFTSGRGGDYHLGYGL
jgi:hypothetical protein